MRSGGWQLDVQFMDVMGSPYLLAHGLGSPVPDAVATVSVPTSGKWRVWARTRKWVEGAGSFRVLADGKALAHVFGRGDSAWGWEDGGEIELAKGPVEIRLRDEDGKTVPAVTPLNALCAARELKAHVEGDHVKVFVRSEGTAPWTARVTTTFMGDDFRPLDHGSLRTKNGRSRFHEVLPLS